SVLGQHRELHCAEHGLSGLTSPTACPAGRSGWGGSCPALERIVSLPSRSHSPGRVFSFPLRNARLGASPHLPSGSITNRSPETTEEGIFQNGQQPNPSSPPSPSLGERQRLANLNPAAGRPPKISTAYAPAGNFLPAGREILADETWNRNYDLAFAIEYLLAE